MPLQSSGPISLANIATEFSDTAPHSLSEFYRGGAKVSNSAANANVPQSGPISLGNFYGAQSIVEFTLEYLLVAGGGGGGSSHPSGANSNLLWADGGGGGGGLVSGSFTLNSTKSYLVTVGAGGSINFGGSNTVLYNTTDNFAIATAIGGGRGSYLGNVGGTGGSGGGGGGLAPQRIDSRWYGFGTVYASGAGTAGQGFAGGAGSGGEIPCINFSRGECRAGGDIQNWYGGDGGGAGSTPGVPDSQQINNGAFFWGSFYSHGGDGPYASGPFAVPASTPGPANTGNGGSGGVSYGNTGLGTSVAGQAGGSGTVVIRYPLTYGTMGVLTGSPQTYTDATYRYYKFTGSGTFGLG